MSKPELESTLIMCGELPLASPTLLPSWVRACAEKGTSDQFKLTIIRKHIMNNFRYDDAEVPLTAPLLKMISKRNWLGKDGNIRRPSILNALDGLSPFLMADLDEDEVARINDADDALSRASHTTVQDIKKLKNKLKASVPASAEEFMLVLKRFANLLYALFSHHCPLYKCIVRVIEALREFSRAAREAMTTHSKASILWIILLQCRQFAVGEMGILAEFTTMHTQLASKQGLVSHAEVPQELIAMTCGDERKRGAVPDLTDSGTDEEPTKPPTKKQRVGKKDNPNCWHQSLKDKLTGPLKQAGYPSFTAILKYCDGDPTEIVPRHSKKCTPNIFFGRCNYGKACTKEHSLATDEEAERILTMVKKFVKEKKKYHEIIQYLSNENSLY